MGSAAQEGDELSDENEFVERCADFIAVGVSHDPACRDEVGGRVGDEEEPENFERGRIGDASAAQCGDGDGSETCEEEVSGSEP